MPRYHVSSDGAPRVCSAQQGACPLSEEDGSTTPHGDFANTAEANAFAEAVNAKRYGGSFGVSGGLDKSKLKPANYAPEMPDLYSDPKPAGEKTVRDLWETFPNADVEQYGNDYQEFKDSGGDHDGPSYELTVTTEVFDDSGKTLASNDDMSRVLFEDESDQQDAAAAGMSDEDREEFAETREIIREEWTGPNTRVTYRLTNY